MLHAVVTEGHAHNFPPTPHPSSPAPNPEGPAVALYGYAPVQYSLSWQALALMNKQEQQMQQFQQLHDYHNSIAAMLWIMPWMSILDDLLPLQQPLQGVAREQQHDSTSCVVIKEVSKSAQKIGTADRYMPDGKENAVEAARLLLGQ